MRALVPLALLLVAVPAVAQMSVPGAPDPKRVAAGTYRVEPQHTQVLWTVSHLGLTPYHGNFSGASGMLTLDPANLAAAKLTVTLPIASVQTTSDKLTEELKGAEWFDAARFPTASFTSTSVDAQGTDAVIHGNLTLHGVTAPADIHARFYGAGLNPLTKGQTVGFEGHMTFSRSAFGVKTYVPVVSDEVTLDIAAAFEREDPLHGKS